MSARVSDYTNYVYCRNYANDVQYTGDLLKRMAIASLPLVSLHAACRLPISLGMGSLRVWNAEGCLQKGIAVVALAGAFFQHRIGIAVTTAQDVLIEINRLRLCGNWTDGSKSLVKIINHLVYLALISRGGLELSIASLMLQGVVALLDSKDEFGNERWIEGCVHLVMAGVRLKQAHSQYGQLQRNRAIEAAIKECYVGSLGKKWQFPSDHLPVGVEVDGIRIISWNVMNSIYMDWVTEKDSQGLNGSMLTELHQPASDDGLTQRDVCVANMVQDMTNKGEIIALQECSMPFLKKLQCLLPPHWEMVKSFETRDDQDVILFNKKHLALVTYQTPTSVYPSVPGRPLQDVLFTNQDAPFTNNLRIINGHIPGDPTKPGREEFAQYVHGQHRTAATTVAVGDNNFNRDEMIDAYRKAGFTDFSLHSTWPTNIDPYSKKSKGIDHCFVIGHKDSRDLSADEVLTGGNLQETIALLRG